MRTTTITSLDSAKSWSIITDTPVFVCVQQHDIHLCYWSGLLITRNHAHSIICQNWMNLYQAKHVSDAIHYEYLNLQNKHPTLCGDFEYIGYANVFDFDKIDELVQKYSTQTALSWLLEESELVL